LITFFHCSSIWGWMKQLTPPNKVHTFS
jgi:hypothetical protein